MMHESSVTNGGAFTVTIQTGDWNKREESFAGTSTEEKKEPTMSLAETKRRGYQ
jgi:hypothetical protein